MMFAANRQPRRTRKGFTLVELVVAAVAGSILVGAVAVSLGQMMRTRNVSATRRVAFQAADAAAARIAADLQSVARDPDLTFCKVQITNGGLPGQERDQILLLTKSDRPVRGLEGVPEGDVFEVQYRVGPSLGQESLWRRIDPAMDDFLDAGGVAAPVADGVVAFSVEASDGTTWFESWDSDAEGMPHAVRFTVTVRGPGTDIARSPLAVSRRTIAIDRVPLPPESESEDTQGQGGESDEGEIEACACLHEMPARVDVSLTKSETGRPTVGGPSCSDLVFVAGGLT